MLADNLTGTTDQELIRKCQQGEQKYFRILYQRYQTRVRAILFQLCGSELLDDLVQEVFLKVWKGLPQLRQINYFSTWLYRISWNVANDRRRKLAKNKQEKETLAQNSHVVTTQIHGDLLQLHYQDLVQRSLNNLSLEHRAVLVLHDLEELPQKDVAKILNIPVGTVKSRLFNARKTVRNFLEQQGVSL